MPPSGLLYGFCKGIALRRSSIRSSDASSKQSPASSALSDEMQCRTTSSSVVSDSEIPKILSVLAATLEYLIARNEQKFPILKNGFSNCSPGICESHADLDFKITLFHGLRKPTIGVQKYLERIYMYTNCSPSCFVVAYAYMDRLVHRQPDQPIISLNVHRLLITSVMLAAKTLDDIHYNNAFYARVGGVSIAELNRMELDLLFRLDFRLCVTTHIFESYCLHLQQEFCHLGYKPVGKGPYTASKSEDLSSVEELLSS